MWSQMGGVTGSYVDLQHWVPWDPSAGPEHLPGGVWDAFVPTFCHSRQRRPVRCLAPADASHGGRAGGLGGGGRAGVGRRRPPGQLRQPYCAACPFLIVPATTTACVPPPLSPPFPSSQDITAFVNSQLGSYMGSCSFGKAAFNATIIPQVGRLGGWTRGRLGLGSGPGRPCSQPAGLLSWRGWGSVLVPLNGADGSWERSWEGRDPGSPSALPRVQSRQHLSVDRLLGRAGRGGGEYHGNTGTTDTRTARCHVAATFRPPFDHGSRTTDYGRGSRSGSRPPPRP